MAVADVGDEKYILSATMHADERNKGLSEQLGRDVYHYHLHVVYIPVVRTEVKWTKKCKDKSLIGTVKEVINQVSHSKKWECEKVISEDGKEHLEYSYSKLQDRYHDHMKSAGFDGFKRGKVGSTAQHLAAIEYKTMIRQEELAEKEKALADMEKELAAVDKQLAQKENRVGILTEKEKDIQGRIKSIEDSGQLLTLKQIEKIQTRVHAPLVGTPGIILSAEDEKNLRATAIAAAKAIEDVKKYKGIAKTAYEVIRDIVQAIGLLKFNFRSDYKPTNNLTPEQDILVAAILNHGAEISKNHGYNALVDDMKKAKMSKPLSEIFNRLEEDYRKKNRPSFDKTFESAKQKVKEQDWQNEYAPNIGQGRKNHGAEL